VKIYFDGADISGSSRTGPNTFAHRLAIELSKMGHTVADSNDYDIGLVFIERTPRLNLKKPYIQRLDGIWFHPKEIRTKNDGIIRTYLEAAAVVFQSNFDK
jgi:hypothetical protein